MQASAAFNGYWYYGSWRYNPSLTLTWSKDWEEETNGLFPDRKIEVGVFVPAMQVGKTLKLNDTTTVEPWAGAALDVTFLDEVAISGCADRQQSQHRLAASSRPELRFRQQRPTRHHR